MRILTPIWIFICLLLTIPVATSAEEQTFPRYKPSSRSPDPVDIRSNAYGASRDAPAALGIGDTVADFSVPLAGSGAGGGTVSLADVRKTGPVAIIFYRGHW